MPPILFGLSSYERGRGDLPELPVINMHPEAAPTEEDGVVLQSRRGLADRSEDMGAGPVRQLFKRDLVLGSALFGVSGGYLYREASSIGAIDGSGHVSIAGYADFLFAAAGRGLWGYDGTTLAPIAFPDGADVLKVIIAGSRAVCIRKDTGRYYWTEPLGETIGALSFATAENQPDRLLDLLFIDGILRLFGAETIENAPLTTDDELPFQPLPASVIERGIKATGCAAPYGNTFAWVTNLNEVCLTDENNIISNPGLQKKIAESAECSLYTFVEDGVEYLCLRIDSETHRWAGGTWSELASYGKDNWVPQCFAGGVFGSAVDGKTLTWGDGYEDLGGVLERRFRAGFWGTIGLIINNLVLRCNVGQTPYLSGDYTDPQVEMRISLDNGRTWGPWWGKSLGQQGNYGLGVAWRALGQLRRWKGFLAEFRVTAPIDWRVSGVLVNEPTGGR